MPRGFVDVLVVRDEYPLLRTNLELAEMPRYWAVVVTGHPGIGKTMFLIYLLLYRLEHKKPTAVQVTRDRYYVFDEQGVTAFRLDQFPSRLQGCWALVDSNQYVIAPCAPLTSRAKYVVLTTPPEPSRWKKWLKHGGGELMVSELPTTLEIAAIAKELGFDPKVACRRAEKWGPSIRHIIELLEKGERLEKKFKADAETASESVWASPQKLSTILSDVQSLSSTGSAVVFIRPVMEDGHRLPGVARPFIPTEHLANIFEKQGYRLNKHAALQVFNMLSTHLLTRSPAGWLFEKSMHEHLYSGVKAIAIDKCDGRTRASKMDMTPATELITGTLNGLALAGPLDSFYWLPTAGNFPGIDGVLGDSKGNLFAVQATIASEYTSPEDGLRKVWEIIDKPVGESCSWHFVVVADTTATAKKLGPEIAKSLETLRLGRKKKVEVWCCSL
ncbi:hypothetical protein GGX14DRAFT_617124 [Mycena pura]|uniref:Uncharacterized protein n=1 Tax=Mycena pura TaxID=153505 RepID=A0AAD6YU58_9AGAR|nr:hypothetical protein GGX14DRAFT_617124 [Mycena pura]